MTKRALITGITGQDGSYLTELLGKGYEVYGLIRRSSTFNTDRIDHLYQDPHEPDTRLRLVYGDLNDSSSLNTVLRQTEPDGQPHRCLDTTRAERLFGFRAKTDFADGLRKTFAWYRATHTPEPALAGD